jgi:HlyD family secretion protein
MPKKIFTGPRLVLILLLVALAIGGWLMIRKPAVEVDTALVQRGAMTVTIDDQGETRVRELYTIAAPVTGELLRLDHKPGTAVAAGTVLAEIAPIRPSLIDRRSYDETLDRIGGLQAELAAARARVQEARASEQLARSNAQRIEALAARGFAARAQIDAARSALQGARAARTAAEQGADAALHGLRATEATLRAGTGSAPAGQVVQVRAPIAGVVLSQLHESGGPVTASTPLLELGDPAQLEIVAELLSADAVRIAKGAAVEIAAWGGDKPLQGRVRLVEPLGFRKISALGVEEQRVRVIIDLAGPQGDWQRLGHGYRVGMRIAQWAAPDVLQVPIGALFRQGDGWAAYTIDQDDRARLVRVTVGQMNADTAEVRTGLQTGQRVIVHPGAKVTDGLRVAALD